MKDWSRIQERFLRDAVPVRLGGLASDLSRIKSTARNEANLTVVTGLLVNARLLVYSACARLDAGASWAHALTRAAEAAAANAQVPGAGRLG